MLPLGSHVPGAPDVMVDRIATHLSTLIGSTLDRFAGVARLAGRVDVVGLTGLTDLFGLAGRFDDALDEPWEPFLRDDVDDLAAGPFAAGTRPALVAAG
jgi:hypothetical protein